MKLNILAPMAALLLLSACSDADYDLFDSPLREAGEGTLATTEKSINSLTFKWEPVDGVYQYGYELCNAGGYVLRKGITQETSVSFGNLEDNSRYTLTVDAYGRNGEPTLRYTLEAQTEPILQLASPDLSAAKIEINNGQATISWPAVEDAMTYDYSLVNSEDAELVSGTVTEPSVTFKTLPIGDYTLYVTADSSDAARTRSETSSFAFTRSRVETAVYEGTYTSHVIGSYQTTIHLFDDGSYLLDAFYGVEGYDLDFSVGSQNAINIANAFASSGNYRSVYTGREDIPYVRIYQGSRYSTFTSSGKKRTLKITLYPGDSKTYGSDTFVFNVN